MTDLAHRSPISALGRTGIRQLYQTSPAAAASHGFMAESNKEFGRHWNRAQDEFLSTSDQNRCCPCTEMGCLKRIEARLIMLPTQEGGGLLKTKAPCCNGDGSAFTL